MRALRLGLGTQPPRKDGPMRLAASALENRPTLASTKPSRKKKKRARKHKGRKKPKRRRRKWRRRTVLNLRRF